MDHLFTTKEETKTLNKSNLDLLLSFFDTKEEVDIVLAGFVSEVIEDLLVNDYGIVADYLFSNLNFIDQLIRHSYDYSVCRKILQSLLFQKDSGLSYDMGEEKKEEKEFDKRILIAFDRLFLKLNTSKDNEVCSNILNLIKEAIDMEEDEKEKIEYLRVTLYSESSMNALFSFLTNVSSFRKGKQNFNLCLQTLSKLIAFYPKLSEEKEEKEEDKMQKSWLTQNFIDKIEFFKETLENQKREKHLDTNGMDKHLLSSSRIHIIRLIIAALKLKNQPINVTLSLSQVFQTITVD